MRFLILKAGAVRPALRVHGEYPEMLARRLGSAADRLGMGVSFATFDVRLGEYPQQTGPDDITLITGSRHSVYEPTAWIVRAHDYVRQLHARRRKVIGVCFGHQLIASALGGETHRAAGGWAVGVHSARVLSHKSWMQPRREAFALLCSHRDQVTTLPPDAERIAATDFCPVAAFTVGSHVLGLQAHPEFEKAYARDQLHARRTTLGPGLYAAGVASLEQPTDEAVVAEWMLRFAATG